MNAEAEAGLETDNNSDVESSGENQAADFGGHGHNLSAPEVDRDRPGPSHSQSVAFFAQQPAADATPLFSLQSDTGLSALGMRDNDNSRLFELAGHCSSLAPLHMSSSFPAAIGAHASEIGAPTSVVRPTSAKRQSSTTYRNQQLINSTFQALAQMRKECSLCDVVLVAGSCTEDRAESEQPENCEQFAAHRVVLAAASPYFRAMFTSGMSEDTQSHVYLQGIGSEALGALLDYMYTAEVRISEQNVQSVLPAASQLQLSDVRDACCEFLKSQLHASNCLGIRQFADMHLCSDLFHTANAFTEHHFSELIQCEEFLSLSSQQVIELVASDRLTTPGEEQVFEAVMQWVRHSPDTRRAVLPDLMEHVRLPLLSQDYLVSKVDSEPLIKESAQCKDYLLEAFKYHLMRGSNKMDFRSPRVKPRQPMGLPKLMLVIGGQAPKAIRNVDVYDLQTEQWSCVSELPQRRCRCGVAVLNGQVYAVGGFNGSLRVRTVDLYDPGRDQWTASAQMEARRSTLGVAVHSNRIYAIGGFDGSAGLVYAVGGYDGQSRQCLSTVEVYEPRMDRWTLAADMSTRRSGAGVAVLDGQLFAIGGHDGPVVKKSAEIYDAELNVWRPIPDMHTCRRNAGVVSLNGSVYAVGGDDGTCNLQSVEVLNQQRTGWSTLANTMPIGRSYAGLAIVDKLAV